MLKVWVKGTNRAATLALACTIFLATPLVAFAGPREDRQQLCLDPGYGGGWCAGVSRISACAGGFCSRTRSRAGC